MAGCRLRSLGAVSLAIAGTAALGGAPAIQPGLTAGLHKVVAQAQLLDIESSWIMGGSGLPIPPPGYLAALSDRYVNPPDGKFFTDQLVFPHVDNDKANPLFTPEGLYPFTGVKNLELDPSVAQGVSILDSTIHDQISAGNDIVVVGYSQSAVINSLEMKDLMALDPADRPDAGELAFVLLGDPSNPDGGLLSRFDLQSLGMPQLTIPSLGITFSGATPADTPWDTAIYTQEYDGFADFPKYPINLLSDINALLGIMTVHGTYPSLTDDQLASAITLDTSDGYAGHTDYFMIPSETLPILSPLLSIPVVGQPLYDLLEPDMRILVNLGYGDIEHGWDQGPADVSTPMGLFPEDLDWNEVFDALGQGAKDGWAAFTDDLSNLPSMAELGGDLGGAADAGLTDYINAFSSALSSAYSALLPTADIVNALLTTMPAYDLAMFTHYLEAGDLINAIGMPIAADYGLITMAAGFELISIEHAISGITDAFSGLGS